MINFSTMTDSELQALAESINTESTKRSAYENLNATLDEAMEHFSVIMGVDPVVAEESLFADRKQKREQND